ncbi:MAG TPA: GNAT family N-acetyltransferase [Tepidisphaeraceae bacterium]|nr:GNAT family N-acetyltransferase [Tepidisphaeraceae bacterium]
MNIPVRPLETTTTRLATLADVPEILAIEHLSFDHAAERFDEKKIAFLIHSPRTLVLVARLGDRVVGWCAGFSWTRGVTPWGRIYALAVHPIARGRKVGPLLMTQMIDSLRSQGAARIFLEVRSDNASAIRLYQKVGFNPCQTLADFYRPGVHAHRMALDANASAM